MRSVDQISGGVDIAVRLLDGLRIPVGGLRVPVDVRQTGMVQLLRFFADCDGWERLSMAHALAQSRSRFLVLPLTNLAGAKEHDTG